MAKAWSEVAASPQYQQLPPDQQAAARDQYFAQVVAPQLPDDAARGAAKAQFDQQYGAAASLSPTQQGAQAQQQGEQQPGLLEQAGRSLAMAGRNVVQGAAALPGLVSDYTIRPVINAAADLAGRPDLHAGRASEAVDMALNAAGLPQYQPQDGLERVVGGVERGLGGLATGMGAGAALQGAGNATAQAVGRALTSAPAAQVAATAAGSGGGEVARELGAGTGGQIAASLAGSLVPAGVAGLATAGGSAARGLLGSADAETAALAQKAAQNGVKLSAAQVSDSKPAKIIDSVTRQVPLSGSQKFQNAQQQQFNQAVGETIGLNTPKITNQQFAQAKQAIGQQFDQIGAKAQAQLTPQVTNDLRQVITDSALTFGKDTQANIKAVVNRIYSQQNNGVIPGPTFLSLDSMLSKAMATGGEKTVPLGQIQEILRDAANASISPQDQAAWQLARQQWRDLKTLEPIVAKNGQTGNIPPSQLMGAVTANGAGKRAMAAGRRGDLGDLAQIGQRFLKDPIGDSGTAGRLGVTNALKTLGTAGAGYAGGQLLSPSMALAGLGAIAGGARATQGVLQNQALVNALVNGPPNNNLRLLQGLGASVNPTTSSLLERR